MTKRTESTDAISQFEASLDALDELVRSMESGELSLADSLTAYERGVGLYRQCQEALEQAELRVQLLSNPLDPSSAQDFPIGDEDE